MNLESGSNLGPYRIESVLGAGGMGVVYRAQDTRLRRTVAIKVLPPQLTENVGARARFENEARAVAALSHPHICAIYDTGRADDGTEYLVMEYLEGKTLAAGIGRGPLPLKDVLRYGEEIADALHCAHRAGITHRDLKPGNVMITAAGAKLLDFGLAKTLAPVVVEADSATLARTPPLTAAGTIVGTLQYMSPEQIENRNIDHRSDIFSLGVVLYEMSTGQRPFEGSSAMTVVSSILSAEPAPVRSVQPSAPVELERIITTALEKNPDDRWHTAHDVARQLHWLRDASGSAKAVTAPARRFGRGAAAYLIVGAIGFGAGLAALSLTRNSTPAARVLRLHLPLSEAGTGQGRLRRGSRLGEVTPFAISPDGSAISFAAEGKGGSALYVRSLDSFDARKIEGSDGATGPFWSDDGKWIAFSAHRKLWKIRASGDSPPTPLCDVAVAGANGSWRGDTILFADAPNGRGGIFRLPASGGEPKAVITPSPSEWRQTLPYLLPDGKHFLYITVASGTISRALCFASIDGGERRTLLQNVSQARIGRDGKLLYVKNGKLLAQTFDQSTGTLSGEPETVVDGVSFFLATATASFDTNASGVLAYQTNSRTDRLSLIDRSGTEKRVLDDADQLFDMGVSPDRRTAAVTVLDRGNGMGDIWLYDLARGTREPFTSEISMDFSPVFASDGKSIYYGSANKRMPQVVKRALGSSAVEAVTEDGRFRYPRSMSADGSLLFVIDRNATTSVDILQLSLRTGEIKPLHATTAAEWDPAVSPDGRYLAYSANSSGRMELYIQDLKATDATPWRLTGSGGWLPRWRRDGSELYFLSLDQKTISVARPTAGNWQDAMTTQLFNTTDPVMDFEPLAAGETFAVIQSGSDDDDVALHVVVER